MPQNDEEFVSVFDDLFVAGAAHQELSAAERAAATRRAQAEQRRTDRRQRRTRRRQRMSGGKLRAVLVLVALAGGYVWLEQDRPDQAQQGQVALPESVRLVYAVPSDQQADETFTAAARTEMDIVQQWFDEQTGGRTLRIEQTDAAAAVDVVDLSFSALELGNRSDAVSLVAEGLATYRDEHPDSIVVAFVPVAFDAQIRCGEATGHVAVVWAGSCGQIPSADSVAFGDGTTVTIAHELIHVLGGVADCAPNHGRNGHVTDSPNDLMYDGAEARTAGDLMLDTGRDDYYDTGSSDCWDVSDHPAWT